MRFFVLDRTRDNTIFSSFSVRRLLSTIFYKIDSGNDKAFPHKG